MITAAELNPHQYPVTDEQAANLATLLERINKVRAVWGAPMVITSGLRSQADQERINPSAPKSKHLIGAACDVLDLHLEITAWLKANPSVLEDAELWCEEGNKNWVHFQIFPPSSGRRWFLP